MMNRKQAPKKSKNKRGSNKMSTTTTKNTKPAIRSMDNDGAAYARLLMDPCNAKVTHPNYAGGDSGYLIRTESTVTFPHPNGYVRWAPGAVSTNDQELVYMTATTPAIGVAVAGIPDAPGKNFLTGTTSSYRCVAACMKLVYPGAEVDRAGLVYAGLVTAQTTALGDTISVNHVTPLLQSAGRMPDTEIEVLWRPDFNDQGFRDPLHDIDVNDLGSRSAIAIAFTGGADAGVTIRMTAIYEWRPRQNKGIALPTLARSISAYSLDDVLNYIQKNGGKWVRFGYAVRGAMRGREAGRLDM
jgi:hypothetical protein